MIRLLRIARREYLAYVRTLGFWLSLLLLPVGLSTIVIAPMALNRSTPTPHVLVVDFTGQGLTPVVAQAVTASATGPRPVVLSADQGWKFADAGDAARQLQPYLRGERVLTDGSRLDSAAILRRDGPTVDIDLWSRNIADSGFETAVSHAVETTIRQNRLKSLGLDAKALADLDSLTPEVSHYSPKAASGKVELKDELPSLAGLAMGMLLWMVTLTGAGMLLNSVMEEKTSRIIEVLLSSASVPEIMGGKIIGVAAVTGTILLFWMSIAGVAISIRSPEIAGDLVGVFMNHARWAYFALYFAGGYLMFATLYVTVGAFCETTREAQTLLGPMMIIMSVPPVFMSQAIHQPDAPLLRTLTWIPLFTPFMMAARVAGDPPLWEVLSTAVLMIGVTCLELWVAVPAFKAGALATGRFDIRVFFATVVGRKSP